MAAAGNPFGDADEASAGNPFGDTESPAPGADPSGTLAADAGAGAGADDTRPAAGNPFGDAAPAEPSSGATAAPAPSYEDDGPLLEAKIGELEKQGEPKRIMGVAAGKPGWKRRWIRIDGMKLTYHATEEDAEARSRPIKNNSVNLTGYIVVAVPDDAAVGPGCIELLPTLPHLDRVWVFRAPGGSAERDVWVRAFERGGCLKADDRRAVDAVAKRTEERAGTAR